MLGALESVLVTIDEFRGGPMQLVEHAVASKKREAHDARRGRGRARDQIWCVFDRDEHPEIKAAFGFAMDHGIEIAFSNPCVELWFLLHFEDRTAFIHRHAAQSRAMELLGCGKTLTLASLEMLAERHDVAEARARGLDKKHIGDGSPQGSNPSSSIWRLINSLRGQ